MSQLSRARHNAAVTAERAAKWPTDRNRMIAAVWAYLAGQQ